MCLSKKTLSSAVLLQPKLFVFALFPTVSGGKNDLGKDANTWHTLTSPVQHVNDHQMGV